MINHIQLEVDWVMEAVLQQSLNEMGEVTQVGWSITAIERKDIDNNGCM